MPAPSPERLRPLAAEVAARYAALPQVEAVALAGSATMAAADTRSDLDLYVYAGQEIPPAERARIASPCTERAEIGNRFFEPGDEWVDAATGLQVDVMFRAPRWIEEQMDRVLLRHEASVGYSTCLWHNVRSSEILFDRSGWFAALQRRAEQPYPEPLRRAIIAKNHPILRDNLSSYLRQIERAVARRDAVSVSHRTAALLASAFDILFAVNRIPHPGEKRLLDRAEALPLRPLDLRPSVEKLLAAAGGAEPKVLARANELLDGLDALLRAERLHPRQS